ncbi:MAG: hypothetical protein WD402_09985 [Chloroflexota bacterium]
MAGTMPHAIFVETGIDDGATVAAYAAELPGCAVFAASDTEATNEMPRRVARFVDWLRAGGEEAPTFLGDNWYEVERAAVADGSRAAFSLDDLPPGDDEFGRYLHWLELARELLADRLDAAGEEAPTDALDQIAEQDVLLASQLGAAPTKLSGAPIDRLYQARDALTVALESAGAMGDGVRRAVRLAIADDLRLADQLRGAAG